MPLPTSYSWSLTSGGSTVGVASSTSGARVTGEGKTGVAVPVSSDGRGRLALVSGNDQLSKIISLNLSDLESDNPFQQDLGLGPDMVFAVNDDKARLELTRRVNVLFRRLHLADRARLAQKPKFTPNSAEQTLEVDIAYYNIEEDKPGSMSINFSTRSTGG